MSSALLPKAACRSQGEMAIPGEPGFMVGIQGIVVLPQSGPNQDSESQMEAAAL